MCVDNVHNITQYVIIRTICCIFHSNSVSLTKYTLLICSYLFIMEDDASLASIEYFATSGVRLNLNSTEV